VVANGSNGEMRSLCTIDLNPIVLRDSMLFSLLFNDRVAVKPGSEGRNMGPWPWLANGPRPPDLPIGPASLQTWAEQQRAGAFPSKGRPLFLLHGAKSEKQTLWRHRSDK
jgi:hypothetical protein